jgi:hypothetical protein
MVLNHATGAPELDAADDFLRARRRAFVSALGRRLAGHRRRAARSDAAAEWRPVGRPRLEVVALDAIVGAVECAPGFDERLRPTSERARRRWERIALAHRRGEALPPVVLWRTPAGLLVVDGRHRVSVARALRLRDIDAWVTDAR